MLDIIFIFFIVVLTFVAVSWFALRSTRKSQQQTDTKQISRVEPELSEADAFNTVLNQQLAQQAHGSKRDQGVSIRLSPQEIKISDSLLEPITEQAELDFKSNDDIDLDITIQDETEPTIEAVNDWDMVVAFTIMAEEGTTFSGKDIKQALESEQFQYGEMNIFHRLTLQGKPLFSAANILDPGTFNMADIATITTPGILVFAKLPGPINGLALFDELLETARSLTRKLDGRLCDDTRQAVTDESVEALRSRILNLNFSLHSETREPHVYID